ARWAGWRFPGGNRRMEFVGGGAAARPPVVFLADLCYRCIEFRLPASGDEDVGALGDEPPGGGHADAAVAPGNDRDLTLQFLRHGTPPPPVRAVRVKGWKK